MNSSRKEDGKPMHGKDREIAKERMREQMERTFSNSLSISELLKDEDQKAKLRALSIKLESGPVRFGEVEVLGINLVHECDGSNNVAVIVRASNGCHYTLKSDGVIIPLHEAAKNHDLLHPCSGYGKDIERIQRLIGVPEEKLHPVTAEWRPYPPMTPIMKVPMQREDLIPKRVRCYPPVTVCEWSDGTVTKAKASVGTVYDPHVGIAICTMKKLWGPVIDEGRSVNGEVKRLLRWDRKRRAEPYYKEIMKDPESLRITLSKIKPKFCERDVEDFAQRIALKIAAAEEKSWETHPVAKKDRKRNG